VWAQAAEAQSYALSFKLKMSLRLKSLWAIGVMLFLVGESKAEAWQGIVPFKSTREDVTRLLGKAQSEDHTHATYSLAKEDIFFVFSGDGYDQKCVSRLPPGTVLAIISRLKTAVKLDELQVEQGAFRKFDPGDGWYPGMEGYISEERGLLLRTDHGAVIEICYIANSTDRHLCPEYPAQPEKMIQVGVPHPMRFDEWNDIRFSDEQARLDNAFVSLRQRSGNIIYLLIYAGRTACVGEAKARGIRAQTYLVRHRGMRPEELVWIDGGYQPSPRTEVWIVSPDFRPTATSEGSLDTSQVRLEKNCTIKYRGSR